MRDFSQNFSRIKLYVRRGKKFYTRFLEVTVLQCVYRVADRRINITSS